MHHLYITECPEMDQATIESFGDECNNLDNYSIQMIHINPIALLFNAVPSLNEASFLNSGVSSNSRIFNRKPVCYSNVMIGIVNGLETNICIACTIQSFHCTKC